MTFYVDIWLRGEETAHTCALPNLSRDPRDWTDDDVRLMLEGMLVEMHRLKFPQDEEHPVSVRSLSWIVNPYEDGGVVVAIEVSLGAAIAGPFDADRAQLEAMISRVISQTRGVTSATVH
ncbi:MAG: hypothetical protein AB7H96_00640 [Vicinamibacterales bacterium]